MECILWEKEGIPRRWIGIEIQKNKRYLQKQEVLRI